MKGDVALVEGDCVAERDGDGTSLEKKFIAVREGVSETTREEEDTGWRPNVKETELKNIVIFLHYDFRYSFIFCC